LAGKVPSGTHIAVTALIALIVVVAYDRFGPKMAKP
jgi:hypothetical protein